MAFNQTTKSNSATLIRKTGDGLLQWSRGVKPTTPGVYPSLKEGQLVRLDSTTGEVIACTVSTENSVGIVLVENNAANDNRVTILSCGSAIIRCGSTAAIAYGAYVKTIGMNTTIVPNRPNATSSGAGNAEFQHGIALTNATAANKELEVLILATPIYLT